MSLQISKGKTLVCVFPAESTKYIEDQGTVRPDLADANCPVMRLKINRFPNVFARGQNLV